MASSRRAGRGAMAAVCADVSTRVLPAGVDLFTRSVRWVSRRGGSFRDESPPAWDFRYW
jgi:hypothetical protein